jgi:hypothetical protein
MVLENVHLALNVSIDSFLRVDDCENHTRHLREDESAQAFCHEVETVNLVIFVVNHLSLDVYLGFQL